MAEENSYPNLAGKRVSLTFRGLLHFPHSLDAFGTKEVVYDGQGKATALTLGTNQLDVNGALSVNEALSVNGQTQINNNNNALILLGNTDSTGFFISKDNISNKFEIGQNPYSSNNTKFCISSAGYIGVGTTSATEKFQVEGTIKSYKNKIISASEDHELLYGSNNLFSIIVKKDGGNNLYIKNTYSDPDINSPLWIDKTTGEVNIRKLNVANIKSIIDPVDPTPPPTRPDRNSNLLPVGMVCMFPMLNDVAGWHKCDGTLYTYVQYPELGDFLGVTYGGTYGINFKVPDYRELFLRGWGTSINRRNIDKEVTESNERLPGSNQNESVNLNSYINLVNGGDGGDGHEGNFAVPMSDLPGYTNNRQSIVGTSPVYGTGNETRPRNIAVAYYIKW